MWNRGDGENTEGLRCVHDHIGNSWNAGRWVGKPAGRARINQRLGTQETFPLPFSDQTNEVFGRLKQQAMLPDLAEGRWSLRPRQQGKEFPCLSSSPRQTSHRSIRMEGPTCSHSGASSALPFLQPSPEPPQLEPFSEPPFSPGAPPPPVAPVIVVSGCGCGGWGWAESQSPGQGQGGA